jgi:uncharacterized protein with PIN domain
MTLILDASAIVCWLDNEPGAERLAELVAADSDLLIHGVNWVEVQYRTLRQSGARLQDAMAWLANCGAEVVRDLDDGLMAEAARLKAFHTPIALGDVFAVALAVQRGATLVSTDRSELEKIAQAGICQIEFLRKS